MVLAIEVFQKVTGSSDKPSAGGGNEITMMPSAWIINLLMPFTAGLPSMVVGVMVSSAIARWSEGSLALNLSSPWH